MDAAAIRYIKRADIDAGKWDACMDADKNGTVYGRSFYLDAMAPCWDALVWGDYKAVMPLVWNRKFGVRYLYQPYFTISLGVFGEPLHPDMIARFINAVPSKFRYWDIAFKETDPLVSDLVERPVKIVTRTNHLLSLNDPYPVLACNYKRSAKRVLRDIEAQAFYVEKGIPVAELLRHYSFQYGKQLKKIGPQVYARMAQCAEQGRALGMAETYSVKFPDGSVAAFYLMFRDQRAIYSVLGGSTDAGKKHGAFYFMIDAIIKEYAGTGKTFRFEGSDVPGIAFFDAQFGSRKVSYSRILMNDLPALLRLLKR
ncbi:GNAT family N-acetyltransferase [Niabella aurantiaca]|uniref:GNAT family N-acetyltransferase n=1 Tax=Niabella aurantiaca TaxID=379900 RepID=UPI0003660AA5|nr:hypothetical protein [Niabella aurantiaca]